MSRKQLFFIIGFLLFTVISGCASVLPTAQSAAPAEDKYSAAAVYHYSLAVLLRQEGKLEDAVSELEQAIAADPNSLFLVTELVCFFIRGKRGFQKSNSSG